MTHHRGCAVSIITIALLLLVSLPSSAHEVPRELTIDAYLKPSQHTLRLLIRVPLTGLMTIDMPKEGVGYLALDRVDPALRKAAQQMANGLDIYENGTRLSNPQIVSTRVSLPFDTSFASFDAAFAHLSGAALPVDTQIYWLQGSVDALLEYPIQSDRSSFSFRTGLFTLAPEVTTALRFVTPDGAVHAFSFLGDRGVIWLDPSWYQVIPVFVREGIEHVVGLRDLWLFALCMVIAVFRTRSLSTVLSSFGIGQVATTLTMAYGPDATGPWLAPLISTIAAAFLLGFAIENIAAREIDRRWTTMLFGVVSGTEFSIAMRDIAQFAGHSRLVSVLAFGLGVQVGVVLLFAALAAAVFALSRVLVNERLRTIIVSAFAGDLAWHALLARGADLPNLAWPLMTTDVLVNATSWMIVVVIAAGVVWFVAGWQKPQRSPAASLRKVESQ